MRHAMVRSCRRWSGLWFLGAALVGLAALKMLPDARRYLRMRSM